MTSTVRTARIVLLAVLTLVAMALFRVMRADSASSGTGSDRPAAHAPTVIRPDGSGPPTASASQAHGLSFDDVTAASGLAFKPTRPQPQSALGSMTAGIALGSWNDKQVLLLTSQADPPRLYLNEKGRYRDVTREAGLTGAPPATAALFADLDGDGTDELVLGHQGGPVLTVWKQSRGWFVRATSEFGIGEKSTAPADAVNAMVRGIAAGDINGDGRLDLVVTDLDPSLAWSARYRRTAGSDDGDGAACDFADDLRSAADHLRGYSQTRLYLGGSDGRFTDATHAWGLDSGDAMATTPQLVDVNGDGRLDLLVAGLACTSREYLNEGTTFVVASAAATRIPQANGAVVRDFSGDGRPDWFVTGVAYPARADACPALTLVVGCRGNQLLTSANDGSLGSGAVAGLGDAGWAFGVAAEDFANTGSLQVATTGGFDAADVSTHGSSDADQWNAYFGRFTGDEMRLYVPNAAGGWSDAGARARLTSKTAGRALLAYDFDDDGRMDLLVNNADTGPQLFRNTTTVRDRHWATITLDDSKHPTNRQAWGAHVRVESARGVTDCWITSNTSFETAGAGSCHVGLGSESAPVRVDVWWPGLTHPQSFSDVPVDQLTVLRR